MFTSPSFALEKSIQQHLSASNNDTGSLLSGSNAAYYTGINNLDIAESPAVIIDAKDCREVYFGTRVYEFTTKIVVKEIAFDTDTSNLGVLAGQVFNEFVNSTTASVWISAQPYKINVWQVQTIGFTTEINEDSLINTGEFRIIGAQIP